MEQDTDHPARINALPNEHFRPLLDWLPRLHQPPAAHTAEEPAHRTMQVMQSDATLMYNIPDNTGEVNAFIKCCYELGLVFPCDWPEFMQTHPFHQQPGLIDRFDRLQCCQALTALVRGERFSQGTVAHAWKSGVLAKIVGRLGVVVSS
ncbi:MAG: hypothetical protein JNM31_13920 [Flavobacteriales bacterium]|nr:hypothetical protein [Flavobacteriales bacterium]